VETAADEADVTAYLLLDDGVSRARLRTRCRVRPDRKGSEAIPLTIASYNIHGGVGLDRRRDLDRIAAVIQEIRPDIIGLQEVIQANGTGPSDQAAYLAAKLSMTPLMAVARPIGDAVFGNAILTRLPVLQWTAHDLSRGRREPRCCLRADLALVQGKIHVFNCHFGLGFRERREQLGLLAAVLGVTAGVDGPRILLGDFNEWHRGPIGRGLRRHFPSLAARARRTFPAVLPLFALDRIYWDAELEGGRLRIHSSRLARVASDHRPVVIDLHLSRHTAPPHAGDAGIDPRLLDTRRAGPA
jgi:endonuclease/exonuclease/phosphatase family metal-dependent hydrolase